MTPRALAVLAFVGLAHSLTLTRGEVQPVLSPCTGDAAQYSAPNDVLQARAYTLTPALPRAGDALTASVTGVLTEAVTDATIVVDVTLGGLVPLQQNIAFSAIPHLQRLLPLQPGPFEFSDGATLPPFLFGTVDGTVRIVSNTGKQISCVKVHVEL